MNSATIILATLVTAYCVQDNEIYVNIRIIGNYSVPVDVDLRKLITQRHQYHDGLSFDDSRLTAAEKALSDRRLKNGLSILHDADASVDASVDAYRFTYNVTQEHASFYRTSIARDGFTTVIASPNEITYVVYGADIEIMYTEMRDKCSADYHMSDLGECDKKCNRPCDKTGVKCPLKYCVPLDDSSICAYRCGANVTLRAVIAGVTVVLVILAIVCFCRAFANQKARYNADNFA